MGLNAYNTIQCNTIVTWCTLIYKIKSSSSILQSQYCLCSDVKGVVIEMGLQQLFK